MNAVTSQTHVDANPDSTKKTSAKSGRTNSAAWLLADDEEKAEVKRKVDIEQEVERALSGKTTSAVYVGGQDSDFAITTSAESADEEETVKKTGIETKNSQKKKDVQRTPADTPVEEEVESEDEASPIVLGQATTNTAKSRSTVKTTSTVPTVVPLSQVLANTSHVSSRRPAPPVDSHDQKSRRRHQQRQTQAPVAARERRAKPLKKEAAQTSPFASTRAQRESSFVGARPKREVSFVVNDDDVKTNRVHGDCIRASRPKREASFSDVNKDGGDTQNNAEADAFSSARHLALARQVYTPTRELSNVSARATLTREKSTFSLKREKSNLTSPSTSKPAGRRRAPEDKAQREPEEDILFSANRKRAKPAFMTEMSTVTSKTNQTHK